MKGNNISVFGNLNTKVFYIVSQEREFELNEYFILEDEKNSTPIEVIETFDSPVCMEGMLPIDVPDAYIEYLKLDKMKRTHFAKVKVLNHLQKPILSNTVRPATFDELESLLINHSNPNEALVLGTIQGTSSVYDMMPSKYQDIAPLFNKDKMIKQDGVPFLVDIYKQKEYPHSGYFGGSGSGKSYALKSTCEELMKLRIPGILLDPHQEMEFKDTYNGINYKERNEVLFIGDDIGIKFTELEIDELIRLFDFVDVLTEPQKACIEALYKKGMTFVQLKNIISKMQNILEEKETSNKFSKYLEDLSKDNPDLYISYLRNKEKLPSSSKSLQAISWKLEKLYHCGVFSDSDIKSIECALLEGKLAIIRGNMMHLKMISSYVIEKLYRKRRAYQDNITKKTGKHVDYFPMFFIILDEAHNFAPNTKDSGMNPTKQMLKKIAQEARKYGVFEIMCTQRIGLLDTTIVAQMNNKFVFRTTNAQDMETIEKECNLTEEELRLLPDLPSGHCIATSPVLSKNFPIRFRACFTKSPHTLDCFAELNDYMKENVLNRERVVEDLLIGYLETVGRVTSKQYPSLIEIVERAKNKKVTIDEVLLILDNLCNIGKVTKKESPFGGATYLAIK